MAEKKEYVKLWVSYRAYFKEYTPGQIGNIVLAMLDYKENGHEPEFDGEERFVWPAIRRDIDAASDAQEKQAEANRENGKKGGRKPKPFSESEEKRKNPFGFLESEKSQGKGKGQGKGHGQGQSTARARANETGFELFWAEYPKKVGKAAARKAFDKVKEPVGTLVDAVKSQKCSEQWTKENGQFIPNPTTWLNQERWADDLTPKIEPNPSPASVVSMDDIDRMIQAAQWAQTQGGTGDG